ncbi:MAG: cytochrome c maturation protein CcmE [Candidatus Hydrothermarchaeota archaeon]
MTGRRRKELKLLLAVAIIAVSLWFAAGATENFLNPIRYVSEVAAQPQDYMGRSVQVAGLIVEGSWVEVGPNAYSFLLTDGNATIKVEYAGPLPGTFKPGVGITAIGTMTGADTLRAEKLLAKCPSKYQQELGKVYEEERAKERA